MGREERIHLGLQASRRMEFLLTYVGEIWEEDIQKFDFEHVKCEMLTRHLSGKVL